MTATAQSEKSLYQNMDKSIAEGLKALEQHPDLSFEFCTNAHGGLEEGGHALRAKRIINVMNDAMGGHSRSSINEAFSGLLAGAKAAYRSVTEQRLGENSYTTVIGPAFKR